MNDDAMKQFLKAVSEELHVLGPFEHRRAMADIRSDLEELAIDGTSAPPTPERLQVAAQSMPSPREVAREYLASSRPPRRAIRLSLAINAALFTAIVLFGAEPLSAAYTSGWGPGFPTVVVGVLFLIVGLFGLFVCLLSFLAPQRGLRWRFAVLPVAGVAVVIDAILAAIAISRAGLPPGLVSFASAAVLLGGAYSVAYAHGQLPRIARPRVSRRPTSDYFDSVSVHLRDLDRVRREEIIDELRGHASAAGLQVDALPPDERFAAIERKLGSPEEVADGYLRGLELERLPRTRRTESLLLLVALLGLAVGAALLWVGLSWTVWQGGYVTLRGLVASVVLLPLSLGVLAGVLRMKRSRLQWPDIAPPSVALAFAVVLILAATLGAAAGLMEPITPKTFTIRSTYADPDGGLHILWAEGYAEQGALFSDIDSAPRRLWLSHLDADRRLLGTEELGFGPRPAPAIALTRNGGEWVLLSADSIETWGEGNRGHVLSPPLGWQSVDGRVVGTTAAIAWSSSSSHGGWVSVRYVEGGWRTGMSRGWDRTIFHAGVERTVVAVGEDRVLLVGPSSWRNDTTAQAGVVAFLFDTAGVGVANLTIGQETVARGGADDDRNRTLAHIVGVQSVPGGFWIIGSTFAQGNGTATGRAWSAWIDRQGASSLYEIHRLEAPAAAQIPKLGDTEWGLSELTAERGGRVFVLSRAVRYEWDGMGVMRPEVDQGGVYLTSLDVGGGFAGPIRFTDSVKDGAIRFPILVASDRDPAALIINGIHCYECDVAIDSYSIALPSGDISTSQIELSPPEFMLVYFHALSQGVAATAGPQIVEIAGEALAFDPGAFEWRRHAATAGGPVVQRAPSLLRIDVAEGQPTLVLLAPWYYPPDSIRDMTATAAVSLAGTIGFLAAYPRWRVRSMRRKSAPGLM